MNDDIYLEQNGRPYARLDGKLLQLFTHPIDDELGIESQAVRYLKDCGFTTREAYTYIDTLIEES